MHVPGWRAGALLLGVLASCTIERHEVAADRSLEAAPALTTTLETRTRVEALRTRFHVRHVRNAAHSMRRESASTPVAVVGEQVATSFEATDAATFHAVLPPGARQARSRTASVELPMRASGTVLVEDDASHLRVGFALLNTAATAVAVAEGLALYSRAVAGADLVHRVHAEGTEDYVVFETKPELEQLTYDVDVSRVAGLRLVDDVLELLDDRGAPRLRVARPYVVDATDARRAGHLDVTGCAFDTSRAAPWGRAVTPPGASRCTLQVRWDSVDYPAIVDPSWAATGSMATPRELDAATLISPGRVLIAGGIASSILASAEIYDAASGTFAATGSLMAGREELAAIRLGSGKVLVVGGFAAGAGATTSAELWDPATGAFTYTGSMMSAREAHQLTALSSGKILVSGGYFDTGAFSQFMPLSSAELFDPATATFSPTGSMAIARGGHTATVLTSGSVLVAGGADKFNDLTSAEIYDPATGTFAPTGAMASVHNNATLLGSGRVLVAGGNKVPTAELYDPLLGKFNATGATMIPRAGHTATLLGSGQVLLAGGHDYGTPVTLVAMAEIYDPAAATFALAAPMTTPRAGHTATLLGSGQVLVAGGAAPVISAAELYGLPTLSKPGSSCASPADCSSGVCDDGVCCASACPNAGLCQTCVPGTGACAAVTNADDPDTCTGTQTCDSVGACVPAGAKASNGAACTSGSQCTSGVCADGVCCTMACAGQCEACDVPGALGVCSAVSGPPRGTRPPCAGVGTICGGHCDGVMAAKCAYPGATVSCGSACSNGAQTLSACDETGSCAAGPPTSCPNGCGATGACAPGPATCATDCAPYACVGGVCAQTCASTSDCSAPNECDAFKHCVAPGGGGSSHGCALGTPSPPGALGDPALLLGLGLALAGRRRRENIGQRSSGPPAVAHSRP